MQPGSVSISDAKIAIVEGWLVLRQRKYFKKLLGLKDAAFIPHGEYALETPFFPNL